MSTRWVVVCVGSVLPGLALANTLDETPDFFWEGDAVGVNFGQLLALGDFNDDGYDELVATSHTHHVVFPGTSTGLYNSIERSLPHEFVATSTAACDVDGDGYDDLLSGEAPFAGSTVEFIVKLYFGGPSGLETEVGWETSATWTAFAGAGPDVACVGDVNADGYEDVMVGSSHAPNGTLPGAGKVELYLGSSIGLSASPTATLLGVQADGFFGRKVAGVGDIDGDGFDDVVIGAPGYDNGQVDEGRAYLFRGRAPGIMNAPARTWESNQAGASFGIEIAGGDFNGDGLGDVVIAAPGYTNGLAGEGRVSMWVGDPLGIVTAPTWVAEGNNLGATYGLALSVGDRDDDGFDDLAVGGPLGYGGKGFLDIYLGRPPGLDLYPSESAIGVTTGASSEPEAVGYELASGDIDGDGLADLAVGAIFYTYGALNQGASMTWRGNPDIVLPGRIPAPPGAEHKLFVVSDEFDDEGPDAPDLAGCTTAGAPAGWSALLALLALRRRR